MLDLGHPPNQQAFPGMPPGQNPIPPNARVYGFEMGFPPHNQGLGHAHVPHGLHTSPSGAANVQAQLHHLEQQIVQEIQSLSVAQAELLVVRQLQAELLRLRQLRAPDSQNLQGEVQPHVAAPASFVQRHEHLAGTSAIPSGSPNLPAGVTIPEGWSLLPLQNMDTLLQPQAAVQAPSEATPATTVGNPPAQPQAPATGGTPAAGNAGVTPTDTSNASPVADPLTARSATTADSAPVEIVPDTLLTTPAPSIDPTPTVSLAQPGSSSINVAETTPGAVEADEAPLPDWSAPFVFPGQRAAEAATNPEILPSSTQVNGAQEAATVTDDVATNGSAAPEKVHISEEDVKGKGKAKAAHVEEAEEDEDA